MSEKIIVNEIVLLTVVIDRAQKDSLVALLLESGGQLVNSIYGNGLTKASYLKEVLGLVPERNRVVVVSLFPSQEAAPMLEKLRGKFGLEQANSGVAFTMPVERLSF